MKRGSLTNHSMVWSDKVFSNPSFTKWITGGSIVTAFRYPDCKKIELVTDAR